MVDTYGKTRAGISKMCLYLANKYPNICVFNELKNGGELLYYMGSSDLEFYPDINSPDDMKSPIKNFIQSCIDNKNVNLIFIPLGIYGKGEWGVGWGHANFLIYNKKLKLLERFEPHGYTSTDSHYSVIDKAVIKYFFGLKIPIDEYNNNLFADKCYLGPQNQQTPEAYEKGGFCVAWTLFVLELRVSHPELTTDQVLKKFHDCIEFGGLKKKSRLAFIKKYYTDLLERSLLFSSGYSIDEIDRVYKKI